MSYVRNPEKKKATKNFVEIRLNTYTYEFLKCNKTEIHEKNKN